LKVQIRKHIPLSGAAILKKALNLFERVEEKIVKYKKLSMQVLVCVINLKIKFSFIMLKLLVMQIVQMRAQHMYEDIKKKKTVLAKNNYLSFCNKLV
jgi:hypothetical protein